MLKLGGRAFGPPRQDSMRPASGQQGGQALPAGESRHLITAATQGTPVTTGTPTIRRNKWARPRLAASALDEDLS